MFHAISQIKGIEGRIWNTPCEFVEAVDYPNSIKAEYDYVVAD